MRPLVILCACALLPAPPALAQVTVDLHALQALPQRPASPVVRLPRAASPAPQASKSNAPRPSTNAAPQVATTGPQDHPPVAPQMSSVSPQAGQSVPAPPSNSRAAAPTPPAPAPALPEQAPQTASIAPIAPPTAAAPPPPPVSAGAGTSAAPIPSGLRLTFAPGQSDLSPESAASIKQFATAAPASEAVTFNVQAYAPGAKDDPSSARRLSLARAMAVRTALVADGVPSAHIFVRALGAQYGSGPPDRVDIDAMSDNTAAAR